MTKKKKEKRTYRVPMEVKFVGDAEVKAFDAAHATAKAESGDIDFSFSRAEMVDWEVNGKPKLAD